MKHVVLVGDFNRWLAETNFLGEMLHMSATRVVSINIGRQSAPADLNARELRRLFPGKSLPECLYLAVAKLQSQGLVDGCIALLGREPHLYGLADQAFAAIAFGQPKVAILTENSTWRGSQEIIRFNLPGTAFTLADPIKFLLSSAAFAVSGMCLCSVHNFRRYPPTIGIIGGKDNCGKYFSAAGLHYVHFAGAGDFLSSLLASHFLAALVLSGDSESGCYIDYALAQQIPVLVLGALEDGIRARLAGFTGAAGLATLISSYCPEGQLSPGHGEASPPWLNCHTIPHKYGSEQFYRYAVQIMVNQLA